MHPDFLEKAFNRRAFLKANGALALAALMPLGLTGLTGCATAAPLYDLESLPPLRVTAAAQNRWFGAAVSGTQLKDDNFAAAVASECNILVAENAMKPGRLWLAPDVWDFAEADAIAAFADVHAMQLRGHTLVWYRNLPRWLEEELMAGNGKERLPELITKVAGRYRGRIKSWDVVNEAIALPDGNADGLRNSPWLTALGPDYISEAFKLAALADPDAQLVYNDFNMHQDMAKSEAIVALVSRIQDSGAKIDAVGIQAHLITGKSLAPLDYFCREMARRKLEVIVTELDVRDLKQMTKPLPLRDAQVAETTRIFLETMAQHRMPQQITCWGLSDRYTWLSDPAITQNVTGAPVRALPLDDDLRRKPMWQAISDFIGKAA